MNIDILLNDFAIRSFRDIGDGDYIAARLAFRAQLIPQFLWSSLQAIEKYLKCILVLNRIPAPKTHDLVKLLHKLQQDNKKFKLQLTNKTNEFLCELDTSAKYRYYEASYCTFSKAMISLDQAVWEIRRYGRVLDYDVTDTQGKKINLLEHELKINEDAAKFTPQKFQILGGRLESIIAKTDHPSREPLLWQNAFFGCKSRKTVEIPGCMEAGNSPLYLHPEILNEVLKYVYLSKDVIQAYRNA